MAVPLFVPAPVYRSARAMHVDTNIDRSRAPSLSSSHRSADSVDSSVASPTDNRYDAGRKYQELRAMTPAFEEDSDDRSSLRSFAMSFRKPRWNLFKRLHRRNGSGLERSASVQEGPILPRKSSLSHLALHSRSNSSMLTLNLKSPSSPTRLESVAELSSRKCYYSIARNCPGWVIGGEHGDACEACLKAGFFGSP